MYNFLFLIFAINFITATTYSKTVKRSVLDEQVKLPQDTADIIKLHGYNVETHDVRTQDHYILKLHRITGKRVNDDNIISSSNKKPVVLLMHGLLCSSSSWVLADSEKGPGYILADAGFDVWMGNFRGVTYSQRHTNLKTSSSEFWNFSWDQMGRYDLPAMIRYIKKAANVEKIIYIGHSQATTAYFVMASTDPSYTEKSISTAVAMAPIAFMNNIKSEGFKMLSHLVQTIAQAHNGLKNWLTFRDINGMSDVCKTVLNYVCDTSSIFDPMCENLLFAIGGYNEAQMDRKLMAIIWKHIPAGASLKQIMHYAQLIKTGRFEMYDNGKDENLKKYKNISPPEYNLMSSTVPVALFYSKNDWLATPQNVKQLLAKLYNSTMIRIADEAFTHLDFIWAKDVRKLLYDDIINYIKRFV